MRYLAAVLLLAFCSCHLQTKPTDIGEIKRISEVRYVMGTLLDITLYAPSEQEGRRILNETFAIAEHLDEVLSTWKSTSPVSMFNARETTVPQAVPSELYELIQNGEKLSKQTAGAFSIAIRPLVTLWQKSTHPPLSDEIKILLPIISPENLILGSHGTIAKRHPAVAVETGGIGKGYAVDKMLHYLREQGVTRAFINFGRSSMGALGAPPYTQGWPVQLELTHGTIEGHLLLKDETLTVSRAHGTPIVIEGKPYAHIFDPATGRPIKSGQGAAVRTGRATDGEAFVKYLVIRGTPTKDIITDWPDIQWIVRQEHTTHVSASFNLLDSSAPMP